MIECRHVHPTGSIALENIPLPLMENTVGHILPTTTGPVRGTICRIIATEYILRIVSMIGIEQIHIIYWGKEIPFAIIIDIVVCICTICGHKRT